MATSRLVSPVVGAAVALLVLAAPAAAFSWNPPKALTASGNEAIGREGIARTGPMSAIVAYWDTTTGTSRVRVRRTADSGATWLPAQTISSATAVGAQRVSIAAQGQIVLATFAQGSGCPGAPCGEHVARSIDGGANWSTPVKLSNGSVSHGEIAIRGSVAVAAWNDRASGRIRVTVSSNAGTSFAPAQQLGITTDNLGGTNEGHVAVAIGAGVIYVSYQSDDHTLKVRRSTDGGATWHPAQTLATAAGGLFWQDLAAQGSTAVVVFTKLVSPDVWVAYRRTTDTGAHWSGTTNLGAPAAPSSFNPIVDVQGGSWRVAYTRCLIADCSSSAVVIRSAPDGRIWSGAVRVTPGIAPDYTAGGSVIAGRLIVAYDIVRADSSEDVLVRTGS